MLKNRLLPAFAFAGLIGVAACATDEPEDIQFQDAVEEPTTAPVVTPAPVVEDTMTMPMDTMMTDTMGQDTAGGL